MPARSAEAAANVINRNWGRPMGIRPKRNPASGFARQNQQIGA
jgi:hypothetical protein